jgi:hypothetical protein
MFHARRLFRRGTVRTFVCPRRTHASIFHRDAGIEAKRVPGGPKGGASRKLMLKSQSACGRARVA